MKLKFLGAAGVVTGSSYLIESTPVGGQAEGERILVDCGIFQGESYCEKLNFEPLAYDPKSISAVFITHAHIDHCGMLPKLIKAGYRGPVYSTPPTRDSAYELLLDSEDILRREAERVGQTPLYDKSNIDSLMNQWKTVNYDESVTVGSFKTTLQNAGHILGSASAIIEAEGKKLVISGDLGNHNPPLLQEGKLIPPDADYCLIESSYGDRIHEDFTRRREILEDVIEDAALRKGVLMVPVFAMERMQELLYEVNELISQGRVPKLQIFIDSPLAIRLTKIYEKYSSYLNAEALKFMWQGRRELLNFPGVHLTLTPEESKEISFAPSPKIIFAGSGMSNGGRITRHEAQYLPDPKNTLLFVGYQAAGTLGRQIFDGAKEVVIFNKVIAVNSKIAKISGYSAHADQPRLIEWLTPARDNLKTVFMVHGEKVPSEVLASKVRDKLAVKTVTPSIGEEVVL